MSVGLPFMKNVFTPLAKSVLVPLALTAVASAADAVIQKTIYESGTTTLVFSNADQIYIMKIVKSLEETGLLIRGVSETVKNEIKQQKGGFLGMLAATLGASLLRSMQSFKGVI